MAKGRCAPGNNCGSNKLFYTKPFEGPSEVEPACTIENFDLSQDAGTVSIDWTTLTEVRVSIYILDRKLQTDPEYTDLGVQISFPSGENQLHNLTDSPVSGNYSYRLRVLFDNSTEAILATGNITVP